MQFRVVVCNYGHCSTVNHVIMVYCFHLTEIRTHGVAYYQFATDEEKRQEQLAALNKLQDQVLSAIGYRNDSLKSTDFP